MPPSPFPEALTCVSHPFASDPGDKSRCFDLFAVLTQNTRKSVTKCIILVLNGLAGFTVYIDE